MIAVPLFDALVYTEFGLAAVTGVALVFIVAPYGRHARPGWGPTLPARLAWVVMEAPSSVGFAAIYLLGGQRHALPPLLLLGLWQSHYLQRTFIYPLRIRADSTRMPVLVVALGFSFNCLNAWINARWISHLGSYNLGWLSDPRFIGGVALFALGMGVNQYSDAILLRLRRSSPDGYAIPKGGLYRWLSCPNYLGEILEWFGWALACWSTAGLAFAVYTVANLAPRALANHRWYRARFADYPAERRALIPFFL